jgi:excisionase family DNA binding protein
MSARLAYSVSEAAQALSLSVRSLRYLIQAGKLGFVRLGRRILIRDEDLQRLLRQGYCRPEGGSTLMSRFDPGNGKAPSGHPRPRMVRTSGPGGANVKH